MCRNGFLVGCLKDAKGGNRKGVGLFDDLPRRQGVVGARKLSIRRGNALLRP